MAATKEQRRRAVQVLGFDPEWADWQDFINTGDIETKIHEPNVDDDDLERAERIAESYGELEAEINTKATANCRVLVQATRRLVDATLKQRQAPRQVEACVKALAPFEAQLAPRSTTKKAAPKKRVRLRA